MTYSVKYTPDSWLGKKSRPFAIAPYIFIPKRMRGGVKEKMLIAHESVHCYRQLDYGRLRWLWHYAVRRDLDFIRKEAELAYAAEIRTGLWLGVEIDVYHYVNVLVNEYWGAFDSVQALRFVRGVVDGHK